MFSFLALLLLLPPSLQEYSGAWELASDAAVEIRSAVDAAVSRMNFLIRGIARSRLVKTQVAFPSVMFEGSGATVRIAHAGGTDVTHGNASDKVQTRAPDGSAIVVSLKPGPPLQQIYESKEGRRQNTYTISEDGKRLTMEVLVTSPRLPVPVRYRLNYRRP